MVRKICPALVLVLLLLPVLDARAGDHALEFSVNGATADLWFGGRVAHAGDVNGDGHGDILVSSLRDSTHAFYGGVTRVYSGKDGKVLYTHWGPKGLRADFGWSLTGLGDLNDDGYDDYAIGCPGDDDNGVGSGSVWVYSGKTGKTLKVLVGDGETLGLGFSIAGAGDIDGDGTPDLIVGMPKTSDQDGLAFVLSGDDWTKIHRLADPKVSGTRGVYFGYSVACAGDVNGDGVNDIAVGDPGAQKGNDSRVGGVHLFSGKDGDTLYSFWGDEWGAEFGHSVDGAGDVDLDGHADVVIGSPGVDDGNYNDAGEAYVYSGKTGKRVYSFKGAGNSANLGFSVSGAGDANGDGYDDVVVGVPNSYGLGDKDGRAVIYSGKDGKAYLTVEGTTRDCRLGYSVDGGGDVNNAGFRDIVIGAPTWGYPGIEGGRVEVWSGTGPWGTVVINGGDDYTNTETVTLEMVWKGTATVTDVRIRNASDGIWGSWVTLASKRSWTFPTGAGEKIIEVQYRDADGDLSGTCRDAVLVDKAAPWASVVINDGDDWSGESHVDLSIAGGDADTWVTGHRYRVAGEPWPEWSDPASAVSLTLPEPDGVHQVEVQVKDRAGNVSTVASDTIRLDTVPPTLSVALDDGAEATGDSLVSVELLATDAGSGVTEYRGRIPGKEWGEWTAFASPFDWDLGAGDGPRELEFQVRDLVGHESEIATAGILLDTRPPTCISLSVNMSAPYVLPEEALLIGLQAKDQVDGSGVASFQVAFTGGSGWSDPFPITEGYVTTVVPHPDAAGPVNVRVVILDKAGNRSEERRTVFYRVGEKLVAATGGGKLTGSIDPSTDVDAVRVPLTAGDLLTVQLKTIPAVKGEDFELAVDLVRPDGESLVEGRYPIDGRKPGIRKFPVLRTGVYLVVLRRAAPGSTATGRYTLSVKVKQARFNKKAKRELTGDSLTFEAVEGMTLKAVLKGEGLVAAGLTLEGPDGIVPFEVKEKKGKLTILPVVLGGGTGTYILRFGREGTVKSSVSLKLPKKVKAAISG